MQSYLSCRYTRFRGGHRYINCLASAHLQITFGENSSSSAVVIYVCHVTPTETGRKSDLLRLITAFFFLLAVIIIALWWLFCYLAVRCQRLDIHVGSGHKPGHKPGHKEKRKLRPPGLAFRVSTSVASMYRKVKILTGMQLNTVFGIQVSY